MNLLPFIRGLWVRSLLVLAALVSLVVFAVIPLQGMIASENDEVQKAYAKMENERARLASLPDLRTKYEKIADNKGKIGYVLPQDRVVDYIKDLEDIAAASGGTISVTQGKDLDTVRKTAPSNKADVTGNEGGSAGANAPTGERIVDHLPQGKTLGLTVTFSGRYLDMVEFVHKVETAPYFVDILSLDVRPADATNVDRGNAFVSSTSSGSAAPKETAPPTSASVQTVFSLVLYLE
ncbi:MAG: hypothetical protein WCL23_04600 [Candidatus Moraniibacteriota bacterium]